MPGQRVLVVDDNHGFRDQVVSAIAATGLQVHGIARGSEALRLCARFLPDLLIVDLVRPVSEGRWLIERLLRRGDETPLGPPPQAVLALVPIGGDFVDLPDGVDLQVKPMFAQFEVGHILSLIVLGGASILVNNADGVKIMELNRTNRESPTLGAPPPENAVVLFDGKGANHFPNSRVDETIGALMEGITSEDTFGDCSLHVEFLLPYMPDARGQGRSGGGA